MPSFISHAPLLPPPRSRHSAKPRRQPPSSGPKKSAKPARNLAWVRRLSTPSHQVSHMSSWLATIHSPRRRSSSLSAPKVVDSQPHTLSSLERTCPPATQPRSILRVRIARCRRITCGLLFRHQRPRWPAEHPSIQLQLHSHHMEQAHLQPSHVSRAFFNLDAH